MLVDICNPPSCIPEELNKMKNKPIILFKKRKENDIKYSIKYSYVQTFKSNGLFLLFWSWNRGHYVY